MGIRKILPSEKSDLEWRTRARDAVNAVIDLAQAQALYSLGSGATADRPVTTTKGAQYWDETLQIPIWWSGSAWKNAVGATV